MTGCINITKLYRIFYSHPEKLQSFHHQHLIGFQPLNIQNNNPSTIADDSPHRTKTNDIVSTQQ